MEEKIQKYAVVEGRTVETDRVYVAGEVIGLNPDGDFAKALLEQGDIVAVAEELEKAENGSEGSVANAVAPNEEAEKEVLPKKFYRGHEVISTRERVVGERTFKHVTIADGSSYDLSDAEFEALVRDSADESINARLN